MRVLKGIAIAAVLASLTAGVTVLGNALSDHHRSVRECAPSC